MYQPDDKCDRCNKARELYHYDWAEGTDAEYGRDYDGLALCDQCLTEIARDGDDENQPAAAPVADTVRLGRTDEHAPRNFDPADYRVIDYIDNRAPDTGAIYLAWLSAGKTPAEAQEKAETARKLFEERVFEHFPNWRTGGTDHQSIHQCNHCGHPGIRWVAVVEHVPTGAKLAFGEQCSDRVELPGRDAFRSKFIKDRAAREAAAQERELARAAFAAANQDVVDYLWAADLSSNEFLNSLHSQLTRKGELSERQVEAVRRSIQRDAEREQRRQAEQEALADVEPLAEGRREITGEIVSVKEQRGDYGVTMKMLVRQDDGNKVWGTIPESLWEARNTRDESGYITEQRELKGMRVTLTATVQRSRDDQHFGFFKRPTGAQAVEAVAV